MSKRRLKFVAYGALLIALDIVLSRYLAIPLGYERLSLQFLPDDMAGVLFGPLGGGIVTLGADILGMLVQNGGLTINPLISLSAILRGVVPGLFLHKKELTYKRLLLVLGISLLVSDVLVTSCALHFYYYPTVPLWQIMGLRAGVRICYLPLQAFLVRELWKGLKKGKLLP